MFLTKIRLESGNANIEIPIGNTFAPTDPAPIQQNVKMSDPFIIKEIDGLGPVDRTVNISNFVYQSTVPADREVTMKIALNPDWANSGTVTGLRDYLYYLMAPDPSPAADGDARLVLKNGTTELCRTPAYIKSCEPNLMSKDPEVILVLGCPEPYFREPTVRTFTGLSKSSMVLSNAGTVTVGFEMRITFTADVNNPSWVDDVGNVFTITRLFPSGSALRVNSHPGVRAAMLIPAAAGSTETSVMSLITAASVWPMIRRGGNTTFTVSTTAYNYDYVRYTARYMGV